MLKKSFAIFLSTALALGILVQGSFASPSYSYDNQIVYDFDDLWAVIEPTSLPGKSQYTNAYNLMDSLKSEDSNILFMLKKDYSTGYVAFSEHGYLHVRNQHLYCSEPSTKVVLSYFGKNTYSPSGYSTSRSTAAFQYDDLSWYFVGELGSVVYNNSNIYSTSDIYFVNTVFSPPNLSSGSLSTDNRFLDAYISGSTYGDVRFLAIQTDDVVLSSTWVSIRYTDTFGSGTFIKDYPFEFVSSDGYSVIKINPFEISNSEFTVNSVLYSGSSSWGTKELTGLNLTFNEDVLPTPIPSVVPVPDYSYYDTTYINYNGGDKDTFYNSFKVLVNYYSEVMAVGPYFFVDEDKYLQQPFFFTFIVLPHKLNTHSVVYDGFIDDCFFQYDVILDDCSDAFFLLTYGSAAYTELDSYLSGLSPMTDVSDYLEGFYAKYNPQIYTYPFDDSGLVSNGYTECILTITDSFYFKQTNYLLGDTGDILSELSDRLFKVDGFSDSLFQNMSSLYNLNLQYFDSSLDALTGLSYWLNDNDISSNLSDISNLLSSLDSYLSSVDGKLNYLVTIDSDLNDLLEWFQNQEDSDVILTLPDFNPSILINIYGENVGDFVEFVQEFVNTLPEFDFSDFPNFFDYAADLVDDTAGSGDDLIGSLFKPYDYDDSGLHEFGWD